MRIRLAFRTANITLCNAILDVCRHTINRLCIQRYFFIGTVIFSSRPSQTQTHQQITYTKNRYPNVNIEHMFSKCNSPISEIMLNCCWELHAMVHRIFLIALSFLPFFAVSFGAFFIYYILIHTHTERINSKWKKNINAFVWFFDEFN